MTEEMAKYEIKVGQHGKGCECSKCQQKGESAKDFNRHQEGMPCDFCSHHVNSEPSFCVTCGPENSNYDGYEFEVDAGDTIKKNDHDLDELEKGHNNGGSTDYYKFKHNWTDCQDIIEDRQMNFSQGNIFKVAFCFNQGRHSTATYERELNKIIWFANRELERIGI